ncbi:MAG: hypothetical protein LBS77_04840 [Desulfovibrio sp.]|jgi:hypothetical protein|nr:hypothetical protein [Desulfovibrio sp.]
MKKIQFGASNLLELSRKKVPKFCNSIIIFYGNQLRRRISKIFCVLPGNGLSSKKMFFRFLKSLPDEDKFGGQALGTYNKQICFENYSSEPIFRDYFKKWFNSQELYWENNCNRLIKRWIKDHAELVKIFQKDFKDVFGHVQKKLSNSCCIVSVTITM